VGDLIEIGLDVYFSLKMHFVVYTVICCWEAKFMGRKCEDIILRDSNIEINGTDFILSFAEDRRVCGLICWISFRF